MRSLSVFYILLTVVMNDIEFATFNIGFGIFYMPVISFHMDYFSS